MRTLFKVVPILGATILLTACPPAPKAPEYKPVEIPKPDPSKMTPEELARLFGSCAKPETEQTASAEAVANTFEAKDVIPVQDVVRVGCNGETLETKHQPVRGYFRVLKFNPPRKLEGLSFIEVENTRACSRITVDVNAKFKNDPAIQEGVGDVPFVTVSEVGPEGQAHLPFAIGSLKWGFLTNVVEGRNVVRLRYYGKCLEFRADRDPAQGESFNCKKPELIGQREVIVQVETELIETPGQSKKPPVCAR